MADGQRDHQQRERHRSRPRGNHRRLHGVENGLQGSRRKSNFVFPTSTCLPPDVRVLHPAHFLLNFWIACPNHPENNLLSPANSVCAVSGGYFSFELPTQMHIKLFSAKYPVAKRDNGPICCKSHVTGCAGISPGFMDRCFSNFQALDFTRIDGFGFSERDDDFAALRTQMEKEGDAGRSTWAGERS
jgi:hypothetical protein